jgi:hypothetical protein
VWWATGGRLGQLRERLRERLRLRLRERLW